MTAKAGSNELRLIRVYDAPVAAVWEAWTDPEKVAKWWGPRGFTLTHHSKDLRVGGHWSYTMHGPDGTDYPNTTKYLEVEKHRKLVYDHGGHEDRPPLFRVTVLFSEKGGKTTMDMTMALATPEAAEEIRKFIKKAGGEATWDRLAEHLAPEPTFVINRSFDAPIGTLFRMWTDAEHFAKWLPPTGFTMRFLEADIRAGGRARYVMSGPNGLTLHGQVEYLEIREPDRLVYTQQFCDEKGHVARHPMAPVWPETMLTTVQLTSEGPEQTRVTVTWKVHGQATREEIEAFLKERGGMTAGWTGSFDKLEGLLASR